MAKRKQLVIHHDDLGASHSANLAFVELWDRKAVTCGSVMVPGPWFPELVEISLNRPDLDIGVHLTLNSEFEKFRWRPLTDATSLVDGQGYFWSGVEQASLASRDQVRAELQRQVEVALEAGIDVTHLDSHLGTIWQPEFVDIYLDLGREFRLPIVLTKDVRELSTPHRDINTILAQSHLQGNPVFQRFLTTPFEEPKPTLTTYKGIFSRAEPGLNWCGFHFACPGDIQFMTNDFSVRIAEYGLFRSGSISEWLQTENVELRGMREIRDRMQHCYHRRE